MTSILKTNAIEPEGATTTLTIGNVGQNVVIGADSIKNNVCTVRFKLQKQKPMGAVF